MEVHGGYEKSASEVIYDLVLSPLHSRTFSRTPNLPKTMKEIKLILLQNTIGENRRIIAFLLCAQTCSFITMSATYAIVWKVTLFRGFAVHFRSKPMYSSSDRSTPESVQGNDL